MRWRFWMIMVALALSACAVYGAEELPDSLRGVQ